MISSHAKTSQSHKSRLSAEGGVALVLTLLIISMLVVVVVGFTVSTRTEQIAARNANYKILAEQLARDGTGRALQKLGSGFLATDDDEGVMLIATQPGRISRRGKSTVNLFSSGAATNINTATTPAWITGLPSDNIGAGWENVLDAKNKVVGRVAYYVDDESVKLPLNAATPTRNSLNPASTRPFSFAALIQSGAATAADRDSFGAVVNGTFGPGSISNWTYFFVPEQARGSVFRSTIIANVGAGLSNWFRIASRFTVAEGSETDSVGPQTPWGTDKILINQEGLDESSLTKLTNAMTDTNLTEIFGRHFGNKYGEEGLQQLAVNMLQLRSDHWEPTRMFQGTNPIIGTADLTNAVAAPAPNSGDLKKTNGIPAKFFGYVPFPMLTELEVYYSYGWINAGVMTVRIFLECTLYNPYPEAFSGGGGIFAQIDKAFFTINYGDGSGNDNFPDRFRGPQGTPNSETDFPYNFSDVQDMDAWGVGSPRYDSLDPPSGIRVVALPQISAGGSASVIIPFDMRFLEDNATAFADTAPIFISRFIFDQVKLLADTNDPTSVRDWISGYDFFNALSNGESSAEFSVAPPPGGPEGTADGGNATLSAANAVPPERKLVKQYDPRLRLPLDISEPYQTGWPGKIWFEVPYAQEFTYTPGSSPNAALPGDPGFAGDPAKAIYNPDIPPILAFSSSSNNQNESSTMVWSMPADLGKVFTGVPWRALRMQPQPAEEGSDIPDWVLLDMIDFTDGTKALTTVNPNTSYASAGGTVAGFGAGLRSQLDVLTNATARTNVANPLVPTETAPNPAKLIPGLTNNLSISNLVTQAGNLQWSSTGSWGGRRAAMGFPTNALLLPSEIVEIAGFADYAGQGDNFKLNEYRIGTLFPGLSTKSRFFKIYAVGEALEGTTTQNVAATALLQTLVEVDDSTDPISITTIYQYPPAD